MLMIRQLHAEPVSTDFRVFLVEGRLGVTCGGFIYSKRRQSAWIALVEQHIRLENEHELDGVSPHFGDTVDTMMSLGANTITAGRSRQFYAADEGTA